MKFNYYNKMSLRPFMLQICAKIIQNAIIALLEIKSDVKVNIEIDVSRRSSALRTSHTIKNASETATRQSRLHALKIKERINHGISEVEARVTDGEQSAD